MTIDTRTKGRTQAEPNGSGQGEGPTTRARILEIALSLMSQRGVDGTSMRDLASAAGLNVASLYHYFPSKRDLLEAVLVEQGYLPITAPPGEDGSPAPDLTLAEMLADYMGSMFEVEDFVRLMVGEAMRGEATARSVGLDLFSSFHLSLEEWIVANRPDLVERHGASEVARILSAMIVGVFIGYAAGVAGPDGDDPAALAQQWANTAAHILRPPE
ncbi:MAG TPA: TetR/AcrR family transcriptional regulator [Acidimicrobiales bacterium]|nr:TetR/AcrR family transcriptional regulator [Acidimicrobiales bacterium]